MCALSRHAESDSVLAAPPAVERRTAGAPIGTFAGLLPRRGGFGTERLSDPDLQHVHVITGIAVDVLRAWQERPRGDTRNPSGR